MAGSGEWVLLETLSSRRDGTPTYFRTWTAIGPCGTKVAGEAERFASEDKALDHPAAMFPLAFYKPFTMDDALNYGELTPETQQYGRGRI